MKRMITGQAVRYSDKNDEGIFDVLLRALRSDAHVTEDENFEDTEGRDTKTVDYW